MKFRQFFLRKICGDWLLSFDLRSISWNIFFLRLGYFMLHFVKRNIFLAMIFGIRSLLSNYNVLLLFLFGFQKWRGFKLRGRKLIREVFTNTLILLRVYWRFFLNLWMMNLFKAMKVINVIHFLLLKQFRFINIFIVFIPT